MLAGSMQSEMSKEAGSEAMEELLATAQPYALLDPARFVVDGRWVAPQQVIDVLEPYVTARRRGRIDAVIAGRTYTVATVVEGLANSGNVSAVMRSAEGLGFGAFHLVTGDADYKHSPRTSQGAEKWLDVWQWPTPADAARHLKEEGYRIVATHLDETAVPIDEVDFTQKTALVFGNERDGVSEELLALSDRRCIVPMSGFVQSFNISVAAAVSLYHARQDRIQRQDRHGDLSEDEQTALRAAYYLRSVGSAPAILRRWMAEGGASEDANI